jgi:hypothetical protein
MEYAKRGRSIVKTGLTLAAACSLTMAFGTYVAATAEPAGAALKTQKQKMLKIRIDVEGTPIMATLDDNATSRDFASLLPLTLSLDDYAATEKVSDLPRKLSTNGAPFGVTPVTGDLTYYAPWGNLAIFHKGFRYSAGLIKLGKIDRDVAPFRRSGRLRATFTLVGE